MNSFFEEKQLFVLSMWKLILGYSHYNKRCPYMLNDFIKFCVNSLVVMNKDGPNREPSMGPITKKPMALGCTEHKCYCGYMLSETQFCHDTKFYWVFKNVIMVLCSVKLGIMGKKNEKEGGRSLKWRKKYA
jgi:hypothetical protein